MTDNQKHIVTMSDNNSPDYIDRSKAIEVLETKRSEGCSCFCAIDALRALPAVESGWMPIDTAPRNEDDFLAYADDSGLYQVVYFDTTSTTDWIWGTADGPTYHKDRFAHWMPLPNPPAMAAAMGVE